MPTYVQRELAGISPISEPALPTESKHDSDESYKKDHELAIYQKELRELDNYQIMEYQHDLSKALNPYKEIEEQLKEKKYKTISEEEANHIPYKHAA